MPHQFNVGDRVRIRDGVERYSVTRPGSYGRIEYVVGNGRTCIVRFEHLTGHAPQYLNTTFDIMADTLELYEPTPQDFATQLAQTIQRLHHRQLFYQEHKHELPSWG